ncbi:MAG TPA: hypothetical protein VHE81_06490 [Lacipirellulaceae bacterium]|jgi:hypothetical protein|nr:hypothetical protein [Lacipirellulaceae bacterium]
MIELVMWACMGLNCRDVSLTFADISLLQCQIGMAAQNEVAKWKSEHPNWRVEKYRCQIPGTFAKL